MMGSQFVEVYTHLYRLNFMGVPNFGDKKHPSTLTK